LLSLENHYKKKSGLQQLILLDLILW